MPIINHEYVSKVVWSGGRDGDGTVKAQGSGVEVPINVPAEFQGKGGGTNPEEMLTSAVAACYSITFGIIAANRKLPVKHVETTATGVVEQNGASFVYKSIVLKPVIYMEGEPSVEQLKQAEEIAHKADGYCIITNAVRGKVEISVEPTIAKG